VGLVDHDQGEVGQRREDRHAGTDNDPDLAVQDAPPGVVPLPGGEARMEHSQAVADQGGHPIGQLRDE
jgi:hypothetical protein